MVIEEPDIEIGAGVSSKGKRFFRQGDYFLTVSQQSVGAFPQRLGEVVVEHSADGVTVADVVGSIMDGIIDRTDILPMSSVTSRRDLSLLSPFRLPFPDLDFSCQACQLFSTRL
jgi:hypothetical protein